MPLYASLNPLPAGLVAYDPLRNETIRTQKDATSFLGKDESSLVSTSQGLTPLLVKLKWDAIHGLLLTIGISTTFMGVVWKPGLGVAGTIIPLFYTVWAALKLNAIRCRKATLQNYLVSRQQSNDTNSLPVAMKAKITKWIQRVRCPKQEAFVVSSKRHSVS